MRTQMPAHERTSVCRLNRLGNRDTQDHVPRTSAAACSIVSAPPAPRRVPFGRIGLRAGGGEVPLEQSLPPAPGTCPRERGPGSRREPRREAPSPLAAATAACPCRVRRAGQAADLQRERERLLEQLARLGEAALCERDPAEVVESAAGLADTDVARKCQRLGCIVAGSGQISGSERRFGEVAGDSAIRARSLPPARTRKLSSNSSRARPVFPRSALSTEVVQGGAEDERIARLLGDGQSVFQDGDPPRRRLRARSGGG